MVQAVSVLPPPPVQTLPAGLLGFLGIKNGGQNPAFLNQGLSSVMDLFRMYCQGAREQPGADVLSFTSNNNTQSSALYTVPAGQMWYVMDVWLLLAAAPAVPWSYFNLLVRNATSLAPSLYRDITPKFKPVTGESPTLVAGDFFMQSSEHIAISANGTGGVGFAATLQASIVRFQK